MSDSPREGAAATSSHTLREASLRTADWRIVLRSLVFNVAFYCNLLAYMVAAIPGLLLPSRFIIRKAQSWARVNLWLLRRIVGMNIDVRGIERIPEGALIVASKHQSTWETFALLPLFREPTFILKRELMWIPLFGWLIKKAGMIPVDRRGGSRALSGLVAEVGKALALNRQIIIFPEGTRRPVGAAPAYKYGVSRLYEQTGATCLPVALNSGLFWPRRQFLRLPGTVVVEFLNPIRPGLDRQTFQRVLEERLETAAARLAGPSWFVQDPADPAASA